MPAKKSLEKFINQCNIKHNSFYDYTLVEYVNSATKIIIKCPLHGEFIQEANSHLQGKGCIKCYHSCPSKKLKSADVFIENSKQIHGDKYDYSRVNYVGNKKQVEIICKNHGSFLVRPNDHISSKHGCPMCSRTKKLTLVEFLNRSNYIHNFKYDYSFITEYINNKQLIQIICPIHGVFVQTTKSHYCGNGCPNCKTSKLENIVAIELNKMNVKFLKNYKHPKITPQHFDIWLPKYNIAIECHGRQHYEVVEKFGGIFGLQKTKERDLIKYQKCIDNNIQLFIFPYYFKKIDRIDFFVKLTQILC